MSPGPRPPHPCPVCGAQVAHTRLMCREDWYRVPRILRNDVWRTWRSGDGEASPEHVAAIAAAVRWVKDHPPEPQGAEGR